MKKLIVGAMVALGALSMVVTEAEAKRMGGGSSFGRQSQSVNRQATPPASNQATNQANQSASAARTPAAAQNAAKPSSPWKGMLGGALLGLGLGALLSHLGLGGAMASMISTLLMVGLIALAAMFLYRLFARRGNRSNGMQPAFAGATARNGFSPRVEPFQPAARTAETELSGAGAIGGTAWDIPEDFDAPAFLRHAKTYFIRLQAAWDKADINDLREFTTPEMYAELKLELQQRGASGNHTDVVSLNAELLGIETGERDYLASVRFDGMISEAQGMQAQPFAEVWNLSKSRSGEGGWVLAGIQQLG
jgi:predicted lipid-binding transport protein (Tim44 family)